MNRIDVHGMQPKPSYLLLKLLIAALVGYVLGALTVYRDWFPFEQFQTLAFAINGVALKEPTPRNALFKAFSPKAQVVMVGDSITSAGEWSEIFPEIKIANRGISGETAKDILKRMDTIYAVHPEKAFVMVGINDIYDGQSVDNIYKNYIEIVTQLKNQGITVYIQSTIECSVSRCGNRIHKVRALNQQLQAYAALHKMTFIDLNSKLATRDQGLLDDYTYDGMHLRASGFVEWKTMLLPYVN